MPMNAIFIDWPRRSRAIRIAAISSEATATYPTSQLSSPWMVLMGPPVSPALTPSHTPLSDFSTSDAASPMALANTSTAPLVTPSPISLRPHFRPSPTQS